MKRHLRRLRLAAVLLVLSAPVMTRAADGDGEVRRQRLINKSYPVTAEDKLKIENQFGNVVVSTWDKQEITIDVEISARAATDEKAQNIMNHINVDYGKDGHNIWFKTQVAEMKGDNKNNVRRTDHDNERGFYIDYVIHMPESNRLDIENSFGRTEVPAFKGLVTLTNKFGSLTTGKLDNVDLIDVEFGRANLASVTNGKVIFKFNSESRIGKVDGSVRINSEFSQNVQLVIANNITELNVSESYSGVRLVMSKEISAQFDVHMSFGHFRNESDVSINEEGRDDDPGPHFDKDFSGKSGDGRARIKVKSSFGSVRFSNSTVSNTGDQDEDDDGDRDKDKHKDKDKNKHKDKDKATDSEAR